MILGGREPDDVIAGALSRIRRDQQARHVQRRVARGDPAVASLASAAKLRYLDALDDATNGLSISVVAEQIGVDRPRCSRLTSELVAAGLVQRETHSDDSRYIHVRLTTKGQRVVDNAHQERKRSVNQALASLSPAEAITFASLLEKFVEAWPRDTAREGGS